MNTNSAAEFGNKVQSCGTEDAKVFYAIGSNLYAEDRVEYFSVFLVAVISATILLLLLLSFLAHQHKACRQLKIKQEMTAVGD